MSQLGELLAQLTAGGVSGAIAIVRGFLIKNSAHLFANFFTILAFRLYVFIAIDCVKKKSAIRGVFAVFF
jgi:hypothetical protein